VILAPLFPPAACWWARTIELSIRCSECGERAESASKTESQTPFLAQRLKRLYAVVYGPYRSGRSRHGEPVRRMKKDAAQDLAVVEPGAAVLLALGPGQERRNDRPLGIRQIKASHRKASNRKP
jgi:hypothetical protein